MMKSSKFKLLFCCLWTCSIAVAKAQESVPGAVSVTATIQVTDSAEVKQQASGATQGSVTLQDIDGRKLALNNKDYIGTVVVIISTDCPVANSYQPTLRKLGREFSGSKLQFLMVHGNPQTTIDQARKHQQEYQIDWPVVLDSDQRVAIELKAKNIPEAYLLDSKGTVLYRGRIDDQYAALGKKRPAPTEHNLSEAITAFLNGQPIPQKETQAVGCVIRYSQAASQVTSQAASPSEAADK